ncbi:MAG: hypothetical protein GXP36_07230 [Actinobacteria bacterium]|nr:hypothetical protein [Actinomycetota bacterium]
MKFIKTVARIALLTTAVSVLTPGIAFAADTYPIGPLIHTPIFCIQPDGTLGTCEEEPPTPPALPGGFVWDGVIVDPPIFDPGLIFPTDPGPGVEEPGDEAPAEEPADDAPVVEEPPAEAPHDDAPVAEEPPAEAPHDDAPVAVPSDEEAAPVAATPSAEVIEATTPAGTAPDAVIASGPVEVEDTVAAGPGFETQSQGLPAWMAALGGMFGALALFGAHALGKRDA